MRRSFAAQPDRRPAPISLTPLIDVVFILLTFFLLASTFDDRIAIPLQPADSAGTSSAAGESILVSIGPGWVGIGRDRLSPQDARSRLERIGAERGPLTVLMRPMAEADAQDMVDALTALDGAPDLQIRILEDAP